MIDLIKLFEKIKWAENGGIADFSEGSYKSGWAFLGDDTPTVQDFNFVQQMNDKKDKWLYNQINEVLKSEGLTATEQEIDTLLKSIKKMAQGYSTPKEIRGDSDNTIDGTGHTHKIVSANTERKGVVQLTEDLTSESLELGLAAKAGKKLKDLIDALTRSLGNYIPNSKKSSAVDSPSVDTVATSAAVKSVQDNANGRVLKAGDTMTGNLVIQGAREGGFANGLILKNILGKLGAGAFIDFSNSSNFPQASLHFTDRGNFSTGASILTTPEGAGFDKDRREVHTNFNQDGRLWVKAYGWLHDFFLAASTFWDFVNKFQFYSVTGPTSVSRYVKIPCKDGKGIKISFGHTNVNASWQDFNLAEDFGSFLIAIGVDRGAARIPIGMEVLNNKTVRIHTGGPAGVNFLFVGEYNH